MDAQIDLHKEWLPDCEAKWINLNKVCSSVPGGQQIKTDDMACSPVMKSLVEAYIIIHFFCWLGTYVSGLPINTIYCIHMPYLRFEFEVS